MKRFLAFSILLSLSLSACKQELPQKLEEPNAFGTIQEIKTLPSEKMLIYGGGEDPYKANWGTATAYHLKVDGQVYFIHWDDAAKFKELKVGDKVNLHPGEFIACEGQNDLKPTCHRLMRVYKADRKINPLGGL